MGEGTLSEGLSAFGAWRLRLSVGGVELMPKRARLEKAVGSASPETFTTRFAADGFGEKDRGRKRCEGARRKEQRSGGALGSEAAIDRPWHLVPQDPRIAAWDNTSCILRLVKSGQTSWRCRHVHVRLCHKMSLKHEVLVRNHS